MDNYESTRRVFLRKLGLSVGMAVAATGVKGAQIIEKNIEFPLTDDQQNFIKQYEVWMSSFIEVIKERRSKPNDLDVNMRLMKLSEKHETWQKEVQVYMEDPNFAKHYMIVTERMTLEIG